MIISNGLSLKDEFDIWRAVKRQAASLKQEAKAEKNKLRKKFLKKGFGEATVTNTDIAPHR